MHKAELLVESRRLQAARDAALEFEEVALLRNEVNLLKASAIAMMNEPMVGQSAIEDARASWPMGKALRIGSVQAELPAPRHSTCCCPILSATCMETWRFPCTA